MHGIVPEPAEHLRNIAGFLGSYYLVLALMNGIAAFYLWQLGRDRSLFRAPILDRPITSSQILLLVAVVFTLCSAIAYTGGERAMLLITMPEAVKAAVNWMMNPVAYSVGTLVILWVLFLFRTFFVQPIVVWPLLNLSLLFMGLSMTDPNFAAIVMKPDNVPIVAMVYLLGFFTWIGAYKAVRNDQRLKEGLGPLEKEDNEKILVWPDLVYTELICMVAVTALLLFWGIALQAPLEEPASAVKTPNPSKAPWYFLGLQEMLVYYDPWMAGVVLPSVIVVGLMAIPFIDFNKRGIGYYTIDERKFAYVIFQFGFLFLWVTLIVMGTFLRGPNWAFFGPFEQWDVHKVEAMNNVDLSQYFWNGLLNRAQPRPPEDAGLLHSIGVILLRESVGIILLILYFAAIPPALVLYSKFFRGLFLKMGFIRYMTLAMLLLLMMLLPIKMFFRWTVDLKYFIAIPEYFLNF
jgi:hypothetical protein